MAEEEKKTDLFQQMATVVPPRNVETTEVDSEGEGQEPTEDRFAYSPKMTDMQVADKRLNPDLGVSYLNILEMSRTFPDVYNPLFRILVKSEVRKSLREKGKKKTSLAEIMAKVNTALSISIDGEGRIDVINIMGRAMTNEEEKAKTGI